MKRLTTFAGLKKGTKIKVVANTNSHNYPMNKPLTIRRDGKRDAEDDFVHETHGNQLSARDCILHAETEKDLQKRLAELTTDYLNEKTVIERKLAFIKETKTEEYNDELFQVYSILQSLKSKEDDIDKAKEITSLLKI